MLSGAEEREGAGPTADGICTGVGGGGAEGQRSRSAEKSLLEEILLISHHLPASKLLLCCQTHSKLTPGPNEKRREGAAGSPVG